MVLPYIQQQTTRNDIRFLIFGKSDYSSSRTDPSGFLLSNDLTRILTESVQEFGEALPICVQVRGVSQEVVIDGVRPANLREALLVPEEETRCGFDAANSGQWPASVSLRRHTNPRSLFHYNMASKVLENLHVQR